MIKRKYLKYDIQINEQYIIKQLVKCFVYKNSTNNLKKWKKDIYYLVGKNIKKQRKIKGLTQLQLANKTFFSYEFIRKIESKSACRNTFSLDTLSKIAQALDIDIRLLFAPLEDGDTSNNTQKMA